MTGYGAADGPLSGGHLAIEIRTVNHRHFSVQLRVPSTLLPVESELRSRLRHRIDRGHVTMAARWTEEPPETAAVRVNLPRARAITQALLELKDTLGLSGEIDLAFLARQPDVLTPVEGRDVPIDRSELLALLDRAVDVVLQMRGREGAALAEEVERLLHAIEQEADQVATRAPLRLATERERLQRSVGELLAGKQTDDERLAQELALLADKLDITEELVRLRTHIEACRATLRENGPVGRQLTFLGQEMLREANTIGSKANDAQMAQSVVRIKGELDKLREQVENLE
jgi:uncharacterized protein (TIGR00255 family)